MDAEEEKCSNVTFHKTENISVSALSVGEVPYSILVQYNTTRHDCIDSTQYKLRPNTVHIPMFTTINVCQDKSEPIWAA